ncbi:MAK3 [Symbiodinium pilosum]|uniref:MAK3 protein n=1 Tax=Symbiodinium pilosum TaxID=2952 RepID=A0A812XK51_SYMPI|nr:MAK3 [Symbiodinium pilosum]
MGAVASRICSPAGEAPAPAAPPKASCSIAGYDFDPVKDAQQPEAFLGKLEESSPTRSTTAESECVEDKHASITADLMKEPAEFQAPKPAPTTPITVETLQGDWVNSMGAKIHVAGTEVSLNGLVMKAHPILLNEDGTVSSVGRIWQLNGWLENDKVEFKEAPSKEVMQFARSVVWSKVSTERMEAWTEQMKAMGYAGSANNPLARGIEGCCPGTSDAHAKLVADDENKDKAELKLLNDLICKWRVPGLIKVPPRKVIPDFSNRGHTGLSVEHVHYLATSFKEKGFQKRKGNEGHDIPVLVCEKTSSELGRKSIENWRSKLQDEKGFAPEEHYERLFKGQELYTSLGNGHFNQALNLFFRECPSIYSQEKYLIGKDRDLKEAIYQGIGSIVLRAEIPLRDRETISKLLNSKREFKWNVSEDGTLDITDAFEDTRTCKQFEASEGKTGSIGGFYPINSIAFTLVHSSGAELPGEIRAWGDRQPPRRTLFYWWGGINRHLIINSVYYLFFLLILYYVQNRYPITQVDASTNGISMLGSLTVFLLVFRMNQSMARNNEATQRTDEMFGELDFLVHSVCTFMQGAGEDSLQELIMNPSRKRTEEEIRLLRLHGELASAVRIHVVRLTIAFGVSVLLYFRVLCALSDSQGVLEEEDLVQIVFLHGRLQALLYEEEMEVVDQYVSLQHKQIQESFFRSELGIEDALASLLGGIELPANPQAIARLEDEIGDAAGESDKAFDFIAGSIIESVCPAKMRVNQIHGIVAINVMPRSCNTKHDIVILLGVGYGIGHSDGTILWQGACCRKKNTAVKKKALLVPFREVDRPWIQLIEAQSFGLRDQSLHQWLMQAAKPGSRTSVDVAISGASVAGYCAWRLEGDLHSPVLYILSLAVDLSERRRGHAAELLRSAMRRGESSGAAAATLHVRVDNEPANALYSRLGFVRGARVRNYYGHCDAWELLRMSSVRVAELWAAAACRLVRKKAESAYLNCVVQGVLVSVVNTLPRKCVQDCAFVPQTCSGSAEGQAVWRSSTDALDQLTHLAGLIMRPVSLAYYQHCRVIVALFSFMWPLVHPVSDELVANIFDSIVFPWVVYWAMSGLERLAEMMENPVGDDDTDIDLMQQMHELEVGLQLSFELSETRRSMMRRLRMKSTGSEHCRFWRVCCVGLTCPRHLQAADSGVFLHVLVVGKQEPYRN